MNTHNIPLDSLIPKRKSKVLIDNGEFHMPAELNGKSKEANYVKIPGAYMLPFRVDMTLRLSCFAEPPTKCIWRIGKGSVQFNGGHISAFDPLTGESVTPNAISYNDLPNGDFADVSVLYGKDAMWVLVNGKHCFSSTGMPYMKLLQENAIPESYIHGLDIEICGGTATKLVLQSVSISEYQNDEPDIPAAVANAPALSPFELYVQGLPPVLREEMIKTDAFLLNDMKDVFKFKRKIDKYGHLRYQSSTGFQYTVFEYGTFEFHETNWDYQKKPDYTDAIFVQLAKSSQEFAQRMFSQLWDCRVSPTCKRITTNEFDGNTKKVCRSTIVYGWQPSDFDDVRKVVAAAHEAVKAAK